MTIATMQSTFLTKENFNIKKNHSEISDNERQKLKFLLNKTKEAEKFEEEFYQRESIEDPEIRAMQSWALLNARTKNWIEEAKHSPI